MVYVPASRVKKFPGSFDPGNGLPEMSDPNLFTLILRSEGFQFPPLSLMVLVTIRRLAALATVLETNKNNTGRRVKSNIRRMKIERLLFILISVSFFTK